MLATGSAAAPAPGGDEAAREHDIVLLRKRGGGTRELRCRVLLRYEPEHLIVQVGGDREELPHADVVSMTTARDRLRGWLELRREGLDLDEEWALAQAAEAAHLSKMARLQAYHVLLRDRGHRGAHELLGHDERRGAWRWTWPGDPERKSGWDELEKLSRDWDGHLVLDSENFTLHTNAGLRRGIDVLFDLECLYVDWLDRFGARLRAAEDVDEPHERMTLYAYAAPEQFKEMLTQEREPYYDPSLESTTKLGHTNLAYTYFSKDHPLVPYRLFDVATQQLLYSTLLLGKRQGAAPPNRRTMHAHWVELGLGYWMERQWAGNPGYAYRIPFLLDADTAAIALQRAPHGSPLNLAREEITNLIGLPSSDFYGTGDAPPVHRAKARAWTAYLLEADPQLREGFEEYLRDVYGTPTAHSSSKLDEALGTKIQSLQDGWIRWLLKHV